MTTKLLNLGRRLRSSLTVIVISLLPIVQANASDIHGVGIKKLAVTDPIHHQPMETVVFFPSAEYSEATNIGPYQIAASKSVSIGSGVYPLVLLSHGNMGSMWGHHDLATALAMQGFIVVSVTHPGDNFQDPSLIGTTSVLYGRPLQISAALSAAFDDARLGPHVDKQRVGFLGFSAGGTTGLILAGAKPTLNRLVEYCATRPQDRHVCEAGGEITQNSVELAPTADQRIRAFALLAPLSVIFAPERLQAIPSPLSIFVGDEDEELSSDANGIALAKSTNASLQVIQNAGHFVFLSPCSAEMKQAVPDICVDSEGVDRIAIHQHISGEIAAFFKKTFDIN